MHFCNLVVKEMSMRSDGKLICEEPSSATLFGSPNPYAASAHYRQRLFES